MKKFPLFILYWVAAFGITFGTLNLYSDSLYSDFIEKENACINISKAKEVAEPDDCLIEHILGLDESEMTPAQSRVLGAHQAADSFNTVLLLGSILLFLITGFVSWLMTFKRKVKNA